MGDDLEHLMMEGDLLEVGLDETIHMWAILQIQRPLLKENCRVMSAEYRRQLIKDRKKRRKRKSEDVKPVQCLKVVSTNNGAKISSNNTTTYNSTSIARMVVKKVKGNGRAKLEEKDISQGIQNSDDEQDEDDCSARPCQKPLG